MSWKLLFGLLEFRTLWCVEKNGLIFFVVVCPAGTSLLRAATCYYVNNYELYFDSKTIFNERIFLPGQ